MGSVIKMNPIGGGPNENLPDTLRPAFARAIQFTTAIGKTRRSPRSALLRFSPGK